MGERLVGRAEELGRIEHSLSELEQGRPGLLELIGEPGIGKSRLLAELAGMRGCARLHRAHGQRRRARARSPVLGLRRRPRRVRPRPRSAAARRARGRRPCRARLRASVAQGARTTARAGLHDERYRAHRAISRAARAALVPEGRGAHPRRPPLGGLGIGRAARSAAAPAAGRARPDRAGRPAASGLRAPRGRPAAGTARRRARADRARRADPQRSGGAPRAARRCPRRRALRGERRQSLLPRAARALGREATARAGRRGVGPAGAARCRPPLPPR